MKLEDVQRVKSLEAVILQAQRNIEGWEEMKKATEVKIASNCEQVYVQPKYVTGEMKDRIIDILIEEQKKFLDKQIAELETI